MKKNGFTLIELLATLMLLAIISMITVPLIMNVIGDIRAKAFERSVEGVIRIIYDDSASTKFSSGSYRIFDGSMRYNNRVIETKGDVLGNGTIIIDSDGDIKLGIKYDSTCATKDFADVKVAYIIGSCDIPIIGSSIDYSWFNEIGINSDILDSGLQSYQYRPTIVGVSTNNQLTLDTNPWGLIDVMYRSTSNGGLSFGNVINYRIPLKSKNNYRFSVWVKNVSTTGAFNLSNTSTYTSQTTSAETITLTNGTNGSNDSNISTNIRNEWVLMIGYLYNYGSVLTTNLDSVYNVNGISQSTSIPRKMNQNTSFGTYKIMRFNASDGYGYIYRPRLDLIDGNEPTIADLLSGQENSNLLNN